MGKGVFKIQKYTIITLTGDRHSLFDICKKYVDRQTYKPSQWIIVDDGKQPLKTSFPSYALYSYRDRKDEDPSHTMPLNLEKALKFVDYEYVFIFEDDDWYSNKYVENSFKNFDDNDLIGLIPPIYYHFYEKLYCIMNYCLDRTSLCSTAFRSRIIKDLKIEENNPFVDLYLWRNIQNKKLWRSKDVLNIGFKGFLSGRKGITVGHSNSFFRKKKRKIMFDNDYSFLKKHIGEDLNYYFSLK